MTADNRQARPEASEHSGASEGPTDEELMATLAAGDQQALGDLCLRYQNDIFRFCVHYLKDVERARDLAQETFIRVYVARARFDASRRFRPWVLCIARNLCLNELKRKKAVSMESLDEYASPARMEAGESFQSPMESPDMHVITDERRAKLAEVLATLDDDSRELVMLRFFEQLQAREIAEILGCKEGAVRTRLHRILKSLRTDYMDVRDDY